MASFPQKEYWASPQQTQTGDPIRPKSYALTDFFLYGYHVPPINAEEALITPELYTTHALPRLRLLITIRDRSPAKLAPGGSEWC